MWWSGLDPQLVWGLLPRFVGVLYIVAFGALSFQLVGIIGARGAAPLAARLQHCRRDFPGVRRFFEFPTVFWLHASDRTIAMVPWLGVLAGVLACYGGPIGYAGLLLGWLLWLSVEPAGLIFPWDTMLQEAGFLVLFLPLAEELPSFAATALPLPSVAFMFRWFVLRLMLGFAKVKFIGTSKGDSLYLRGFFIWAPLPTPIAWWGHHAPRWFLKASLYFMFFAEAVAPVLGFFTGPLRLVSFATLTALMIGVHVSGNWGYFNLGYVLLSVCLLDVDSSLLDLGREPWASSALSFPDLAIHGAMAILFLNSLPYFLVMNSWVTRTWVHWPWETVTWNRPIGRALVGWFRALAPFHLVNGYGVFPPYSAPPLRIAPVIEGSADGQTWKAYGYKYLPTTARSKLPIVAPHHPRFDQALHYASLGIHDGSFFSSLIGDGNPYLAYLRTCWLERAAQRLLLNEEEVKRELGDNPFPDQPPKFVRVTAYAIAPTTPAELKSSGDRWRVRRIGTMIPARGIAPWIEEQSIPEPELFHPDFVHYKRKAEPLRAILRAYKAGMEPDRAVRVDSDLTAADVALFWNEFIPELNVQRGDWSHLHERAHAIEARFGPERMHRLERLLQRFAWLLRLKTEPHFVGALQPKIDLPSNFRYEMLLHELVADGREAYLRALETPAIAAERLKSTTDYSQVWTLGIVRYDMMMFHIRTFRWQGIGDHGHRYKIPGIFEYYPVLAQVVPEEEEYVPKPVKHDDGEFTVDGIYPTSASATAKPSAT
jgi:hypothetical protein